MPPDPFLPEGEFADHPIRLLIKRGQDLAVAFSDASSLASLVERLQAAERTDVELVALFALVGWINEAIDESGSGLTEEEQHRRIKAWYLDPASTGSLDDIDDD